MKGIRYWRGTSDENGHLGDRCLGEVGAAHTRIVESRGRGWPTILGGLSTHGVATGPPAAATTPAWVFTVAPCHLAVTRLQARCRATGERHAQDFPPPPVAMSKDHTLVVMGFAILCRHAGEEKGIRPCPCAQEHTGRCAWPDSPGRARAHPAVADVHGRARTAADSIDLLRHATASPPPRAWRAVAKVGSMHGGASTPRWSVRRPRARRRSSVISRIV